VEGAQVRKEKKGIILTLALFFSLFAVLFSVAAQNPGRVPRLLSNGATELPPSLNALAHSCTGIMVFPVPSVQGSDIQATPGEDSRTSWTTIPPVSGKFEVWDSRNRFYPPNAVDSPSVERALWILRQGGIIVWYLPPPDSDVVNYLPSWLDTVPAEVNLVVVPWPERVSTSWPSGRTYIATAWGKKQSCSNFATSVLDEFIETVDGAGRDKSQ